ncbi:MAG: 2,3-dimethylmalate dehydratase small subunit [Candidatus Marinimicrobia bacterium]|nr:2,3-dimethylmalate dehydratase small subunit [Candidatus Neomarinimicrobiota bacterium]
MEKISGVVAIVGENVSATSILSPEYYGESAEAIDPSVVLATASEIDLSENKEIILIVGQNFGYGSVNESVLVALQKAGVQAIIGTDIPHYVYRNGLNLGLPVFVSDAAADNCSDGETVSIDMESGVITNESTGREFPSEARLDFIKRLMAMGGVTSFIQTLREQETEGNV